MQPAALLEKLDIPLWKRRFLAWWNGEEGTPDVPDDESAEAPDAGEGTGFGRGLNDLEARLMIAQTLWGHGYLGPGDRDFILDLVKPLSLSKEKSIGVLGVGLGGPAREVAKETGVWITGYEARPDLIDPATEQCVMSGMAKKVAVHGFDPSKPDLPAKKFSAVLARDQFSLWPNRKAILDDMVDSLKKGGMVMITDYVRMPEGPSGSVSPGCFSSAWGRPELWEPADYKAALTELGLEMRIQRNITRDYVRLIGASSSGWGRLMDMAGEAAQGGGQIGDKAAFLRLIAEEANMWASRTEALKSGDLAVYCFLAMKNEK